MPASATKQVMDAFLAHLQGLVPSYATLATFGVPDMGALEGVRLPALYVDRGEVEKQDYQTACHLHLRMQVMVNIAIRPRDPADIYAHADEGVTKVKAHMAANLDLGGLITPLEWEHDSSVLGAFEPVPTTLRVVTVTYTATFAHPDDDPYTLRKG